jgi:hypothetical protein
MPIVLRLDGFKFHFYSNEGNPREPVHIHVRQGRDEAKFWLTPTVVMAYNDGFDARILSGDLDETVAAIRMRLCGRDGSEIVAARQAMQGQLWC